MRALRLFVCWLSAHPQQRYDTLHICFTALDQVASWGVHVLCTHARYFVSGGLVHLGTKPRYESSAVRTASST